jgi:hypothetical protein
VQFEKTSFVGAYEYSCLEIFLEDSFDVNASEQNKHAKIPPAF